jgi:hypothetical protein
MSDDPKRLTNQRTVRFAIWGAVLGATLATAITVSIAIGRPLLGSRLSLNDVLDVGRWIGLPVGAMAGGAVGLAMSRRKAP